MIVLALFILELFAQVQGGCPIKCNCSEKTINCASNKLEQVPYFESLTSSPVIIDLSGNYISIIDIDDLSFDKSDEVKEVFVNGSQLSIIEETAFDELENLQELYLANNFLNSLSEKIIANNDFIILLDISGNYFTDMPVIKSDSLEVLAVAKAGVTNIDDNALEGLPNLRTLLLQENNLKKMEPLMFAPYDNLFLRVAFNPWHCNCKTVKLFDFLNSKGFVDLTEPVLCQNANKMFVEIYTEKGADNIFKEECNNFKSKSTDHEQISHPQNKSEESYDSEGFVAVTNESSENISYTSSTHFYYLIILICAITFSLTVGAVCGSCLTYKYVNRNIKEADSFKQLLAQANKTDL